MSKVFKILAIILYLITLFLSLSFPAHNIIYLYLFLFAILYWQKEKIHSILLPAKNLKNRVLVLLIVSLIWATCLNIFLAVLPFDPNPFLNTLISFGFYIPYFFFWYLLMKREILSYLAVFYLSGLSGVFFDLFFTHKTAQAIAGKGYESMTLVLIAFVARLIIVLTIYGLLTVLPYSLVFAQQETKRKKLMSYLLAVILPIATLPFFLVWRAIISLL
jgi:uncharacterized membrane protein